MNALDFLMRTGWSKPNEEFKFKTFLSREEAHQVQNELIERYRRDKDDEAYFELLELLIPVIFTTMKRFKFTDYEEFKLVCLEIFTRCVNDYEISDDPSVMLFSGYFKMHLRFGALDHLNYYVEDRKTVFSLDSNLISYKGSTELIPGEPEGITDFKMYLALDKLTKREREVITMYYFEGKGEAEIISELGIKESSFPVYLSKSKKAFREAYTEVLELDLLQLSDEEMEL